MKPLKPKTVIKNRVQAKRPQNLLNRSKQGANAGLAKPIRRGVLRRYTRKGS